MRLFFLLFLFAGLVLLTCIEPRPNTTATRVLPFFPDSILYLVYFLLKAQLSPPVSFPAPKYLFFLSDVVFLFSPFRRGIKTRSLCSVGWSMAWSCFPPNCLLTPSDET